LLALAGAIVARRRLVLVCIVACWPIAVHATNPVHSFTFLTTGNGYGYQIFDTNQNAIKYFLERPYRYLRPNPSNPNGDGIIRRNLAFDTYFGLRSGGTSTWFGGTTSSDAGYVDQSNVIRSTVTVGALKADSFFFAPYGYAGNGLVMLLRVTNTGTAPASVDAFTIHNFKLGSAPNPDTPGADGESIAFDAAGGYAHESGPGGGAMLYVPLGTPDLSTCAAGAWDAMKNGQTLPQQTSCSGSDQVNLFQKSLGSLQPGASASFAVAVLFEASGDFAGAKTRWDGFAAGRDGEALLSAALAEWTSWRTTNTPGISGSELEVWRQSEAVLRMGQILEPYSDSPKLKNHGMILASLPPGGWHTGWVRDATYAIAALSRMGHATEARDALDFFLDAEAGKYGTPPYLNGPYRVSVVRYYGDGEEEADYSGQLTPNIEIDGWGLVLWASRQYVDFSGDMSWLSQQTKHGDTVYQALKSGVAEPIIANLESNGMAIADASIWEVHWGNRQHFLYTTATAARGLCDMAALARRTGHLDDRDRYKMYAEHAAAALKQNFVDQRGVLAGSLERLASGANYHDGAVVEAFTWSLIPTTDPVATATLSDMSYLQTPVGGYKRVEGSSDPYDTNEWILIDLRAADVFRRANQQNRADALLGFVTENAHVNYDLIPELYNANPAAGPLGSYDPHSSIPMVGYGAGAYVLTLLDRVGQMEHTDCGSEDPTMYPDAGAFPDGGFGTDGGNGLDAYTGSACLCRAGVSGATTGVTGVGVLAGLFAVLVVWSRKRK
jgi:GH15 family glucan-1,4-alpha-glucosidase